MTVHASSNLDTAKFRKVHTLMTGGATEGERSAARARAEAMASKAGMTLKQAVSSLDGRPEAPKAKNFFEDMMDADPAWKAEHAAWTAERDRKRGERRREALEEFGSEEEAFAETERERLLRETLAPLADWKTFANSGARYIDGYAGWVVGTPPWKLVEALSKAYPFPTDLAGFWREHREWEKLHDIRTAFVPHLDQETHVRARVAALEFSLDTFSDPTFEGFEARLEWLKFRTERDLSSDIHDDLAMVDAMRLDFGVLRRMHMPKGGAQSAHPLPRTNAEKREAVLSMLDTHPDLPDREIARRVGVSPQTVNTWRKRRSAAHGR